MGLGRVAGRSDRDTWRQFWSSYELPSGGRWESSWSSSELPSGGRSCAQTVMVLARGSLVLWLSLVLSGMGPLHQQRDPAQNRVQQEAHVNSFTSPVPDVLFSGSTVQPSVLVFELCGIPPADILPPATRPRHLPDTHPPTWTGPSRPSERRCCAPLLSSPLLSSPLLSSPLLPDCSPPSAAPPSPQSSGQNTIRCDGLDSGCPP
jgi:hypothetical protein